MTIVHFLKKIKPDICYMNCKKNSFQVLKMAHTAVLWLFQVFFIILKWLIHILKKKEKKETKVLASAEFYIWYTYMQNNKYHRTWIFFFFYSILNFLLFAFFLCLLSGHWKLLPVFDLWPSNACIVYTFVTS